MKASILDLRRRMADVMRALDRNEPVKILYRGREKAVLIPTRRKNGKGPSMNDHPAFGIWKDNENLRDVDAYVRRLRKSRHHAD
jgi:antitoxin (DNA-binding transcriptional repressor) of toxin-antitoxin stability system